MDVLNFFYKMRLFNNLSLIEKLKFIRVSFILFLRFWGYGKIDIIECVYIWCLISMNL